MVLTFRKERLSDDPFESAGVVDVDGDGILDIVCGDHWYRGPDFRKRHEIGPVLSFGEYRDDFATIPLDVTGTGNPDIVTACWMDETLRWRENPGRIGERWRDHDIARIGHVETARAWDVDGDGELEIVPNTPDEPLRVFKLILDGDGRGTGEFEVFTIYDEPQGHGLGFGDITGNGRGDFVLSGGWLEAPMDPLRGTWVLHHDFDLGAAGTPIVVADVDGDGVNDLIVGQGHDYGLEWLQQRRSPDGARQWIHHPIDPDSSQFHDMVWADLDGDGSPELVTGKRYRAHDGRDPGADDDVGVYYFDWDGESFARHVIDIGPPGIGSGVGTHFAVDDLDGNGLLDIVAPGKDGLVVFRNLGPAG